MTAPLWSCTVCGAPGARNIGVDGHCATHASDLYRMFEPEAWVDGGRGLPAGAHRPDHGPEFYDLQCALCDATWVGTVLERCGWCRDRTDTQTAAQAALLLDPTLPAVDDTRRAAAVAAWVGRLARAVQSGIVTETDAEQALDRIEGDRDRAA